MGKKRSILFLVLLTVLILGLCFLCTVSFSYADGLNTFHSVVSMTDKDAGFGGALAGGSGYVGGGYTAVFYPDGTISAREYEDNLAGTADDKKAEYADRYVRYPDENGQVYLEKEVACDGGDTVTEEYAADVAKSVATLEERFARLRAEGTRFEVQDDFSVRVFLPALVEQQPAVLQRFALMGEFSVCYGSDVSSAENFSYRDGRTINDYVKGASSRTVNGGSYIVIDFTDLGRQAVADWTADAAENGATMFFLIGDEQLLGLSVSEAIDEGSLYISNSSYTSEIADAIAITIDTALSQGGSPAFTVDELVRENALYGDLALILVYAAVGACVLGMAIFFFIRYHLLAFAHLYTFLIYFFAMILCVWAIPFLHIGADTVLAVLFGGLLLSLSHVLVYEGARNDRKAGKTISVCVKGSYRRYFLPVLDLHVIVALLGFFTYFVALGSLGAFAFTLGLAAAFSGLASLALGRFCWAVMMTLHGDKDGFCNFSEGGVTK